MKNNNSIQNGKGSKQRPCDKKKFDENYESIFRRKNKVDSNKKKK